MSSRSCEPTSHVLELSVVLPCLNERETVVICVQKAVAAIEKAVIHGEVIVADNGSTDGSVELAQSAGARVVHVDQAGAKATVTGTEKDNTITVTSVKAD